MAEDIVIKVKTELDELEKASKNKGLNLSTDQSKKVEEGLSAAKKALEARD